MSDLQIVVITVACVFVLGGYLVLCDRIRR